MASPGEELDDKEALGFFGNYMKTLSSIPSRRVSQLRRVTANNSQILKKRDLDSILKDPNSSDSSDEFIPVIKVPGYSVIIKYEESKSANSEPTTSEVPSKMPCKRPGPFESTWSTPIFKPNPIQSSSIFVSIDFLLI